MEQLACREMTSDLTWLVLLERRGEREEKEGGGGVERRIERGNRGGKGGGRVGAGRSREERDRMGEKKRRQWTTQSEPPLGAPKQWTFSLELTGVVFFTVWRGLSH